MQNWLVWCMIHNGLTPRIKNLLISRYFKELFCSKGVWHHLGFIMLHCIMPCAYLHTVKSVFQNPQCCSRKATNCRHGWLIFIQKTTSSFEHWYTGSIINYHPQLFIWQAGRWGLTVTSVLCLQVSPQLPLVSSRYDQ